MTQRKEALQEKWGEQALLMGWAAIPTTLLFLQGQLRITPLGLNILLNLVAHWWERSEHPFPSQESLAVRMGVSKRSIQREIARLCSLGLLEKTASPVRHPQYKGRNTYDLTPLVAVLNREAPGLVESMQRRREEHRAQKAGNHQEG